MSKWIAEFDLEDGDTMPEHMDLEYKGARIDFHCRPIEQEPTTKNVSLEAYKQVAWERDIAIQQLHELGYEFGQKIEPTTKNDLAVDCISRREAQSRIKEICNKYRLSYEDGERKPATGGSAYALGHAFDDLPSVTPRGSRWISVGERYPKPEDDCKSFLVTDDKGVMSVQVFYMSIDEEPQPYFSGMVNVIAWMQLPKPYESQEKRGRK